MHSAAEFFVIDINTGRAFDAKLLATLKLFFNHLKCRNIFHTGFELLFVDLCGSTQLRHGLCDAAMACDLFLVVKEVLMGFPAFILLGRAMSRHRELTAKPRVLWCARTSVQWERLKDHLRLRMSFCKRVELVVGHAAVWT